MLRSGDWLGHCRILHFFTFRNSWVDFAVCFGSFPLVLWSAAQSTLLHLIESGQRVYPCTLQNSSGCFCLLSRHQKTPVTQCHWKPCSSCHHTAPPCFTDDVVCFGSWAVPSLLHTFFFPSFCYRLILLSAVQRMLFQKCSGFFRCFLSKSNLALFADCVEASVFALVKSSLDCRHVCLLESVLLLAGCCERVFLYHGVDSPIITTVVLRGRPGLFMFLSSPVRSFFSECTKLLIWPLLMFLLSL